MTGSFLNIKYHPDNGPVKGFGGMMKDPQVAKVANSVGKIVKAAIIANGLAAEGNDEFLTPGRVSELFGQEYNPGSGKGVRQTRFMWKSAPPYNNPRPAVRLSVSGRYEGRFADRTVSSAPTTIEFGSKYNEGTPRDRPAQDIMGSALRKVAAAMPGVDLRKGDWV